MTDTEYHRHLKEKDTIIEHLKDEINILGQKSFDNAWEKQTLLNKIANIESKLQNALFESSISDGMIKKLNALKLEIEALKGEIKSGRVLISQNKRKIINLTSERDNLLERKEALIDEIDKKDRQIDDLQERATETKAIKDELNRLEKELQDSNEKLSKSEEELCQANWESQEKSKKIEELNTAVNQKDKRISELKEEIEKYKDCVLQPSSPSVDEKPEIFNINEADDLPDDSGNTDDVEEIINVTPIESDTNASTTEDVVNDAVESIGNTDDIETYYLPELEEQKQASKRSILAVINNETGKYISSENFFHRDKEEIARISRYLAESDELNKDVYVCAKCGHRVKVAKREIPNKGEVLFFTHCHKDITCEWKKERETSNSYYDSGSEDDIVDYILPNRDNIQETSRYKDIKQHIIDCLNTERSKEIGITNVEVDVVLKSAYRFMRWRRAGICANYNGRKIVFELQTRNVLMNSIIKRDIFYRLHNQHVIWIFGADEETGYGYMQRHAHQNTMFFNRRNVFFVDEESVAKSEERGELILKCNYLDPDDKWHYRKETTKTNGEYVSLSDLLFDDDLCKPYYYDANAPYFTKYPERKDAYLASLHSRQEIIEDLQYKYDHPDVHNYSPHTESTQSSNISKPRHHIEKIPVGEDRYIYGCDKIWGVINNENDILVEVSYDDVELWHSNKYRVKLHDKWGIIEEGNIPIMDISYFSIGNIIDGKALVDTGTRTFYIDSDGNEVYEKTVPLFNGLTKYKVSGKWGIKDLDNNTIVECLYDEIGSFRNRLIGYINNSVIKLDVVYSYRVPVECICIGKEGNKYIYNVGNVKCIFEDKRQIPSIQKEIYSTVGIVNSMALMNIMWKENNTVYLRAMTEKDWEVPFNHVDNSYDFLLNETLDATVTNIMYGKRLILTFDDGRISYMSKSMASHSGVVKYNDLAIGTKLRVKKIGFDDTYDRTIWEVLSSI